MRWFLAGGALVGIALGCGGLEVTEGVDTVVTVEVEKSERPPLETKAPPPASMAKALTVLVLKPAATDCDLALLALPSLAETKLAGPFSCSSYRIVLDAAGKRALLEEKEIDLVSGAVAAQPEVPGCENVNSETVHYDADGKPVVHQSCGEGEPEWMEGPSYPINHLRVFGLADGAWAERGHLTLGVEPEPDQATRDAYYKLEGTTGHELTADDDGGGTWVEDEAVKVILRAAIEDPGDPSDWFIRPGATRLAYRTAMVGETTAVEAPLLADVGGKWVPIEGISEDDLALAGEGDWLIVSSVNSGGGTQIVDLTTRTIVWSGKGTVWEWPEKVALPK